MSYRPHEALDSFGRAVDRGSSDQLAALFAFSLMLDHRLSDLTEAVLGGQTIGKITVHEDTTETTLEIVKSGENPLLETLELDDGSIALNVRRRDNGRPAAQIRLTKLRALELGQHFVAELQCQQCNGTGIVGGRVGGNSVCPRCHGSKVDPEA